MFLHVVIMGDHTTFFKDEETPLTNTDKKILKVVTKASRPLSKREIAHKIKLSPPTVSKYVDILVAKGKLSRRRYGNIHLISRRENGT